MLFLFKINHTQSKETYWDRRGSNYLLDEAAIGSGGCLA